MEPLEILKKHFGYDSFRFNQEAIIRSLLSGKDTFVLMPTGGGKSLCYQIPALMLDGITLVISPLIALMKDQVDALRVNGIPAAFVNSTQHYIEQNEILDDARSGKIKLLYLAPERLLNTEKKNSFLDQLKRVKISLIAVDEAHCISEWGHDFRPEYLMLAKLKETFPSIPTIALTATADKETRKDILEKLNLNNPVSFVSSFNRPNIRYVVESKINSFDRLLNFLEQHKDESGIIYCLSRRSTETLAEDLRIAGYNALPYHAKLDNESKARHQELFLKDEVKIIVATIAFGMGIDKSNVRFVVHMDIPKNIEGYYQETGRAGRDGLESIALLFYSLYDVTKMKKLLTKEENPEQTAIVLNKLDHMVRFAELNSCRRKFLLNYFDEQADDHCGNCDYCLQHVELYDATSEALKALKAVQVLEEKFGAGYVTDLLWGSTSAKIQAEHKALSIYASGNATSKQQWQLILSGLVTQGYLAKTKGLYPLLKLTDKGISSLESGEKIILTKVKSDNTKLGFAQSEDLSPILLQELKMIRRQLAQDENVPAFVVLSDASLHELAAYLPTNIIALESIAGFGEIKTKKYGQAFVTAIQKYCAAQGLETKIHLKKPKVIRRDRVEQDSATKQVTLKLFNEGFPVKEIAEKRKLSESTIEGHLAFYIQLGKIPIEQMIKAEKIPVIQETVSSLGEKTLTPIKLALGDEYSYAEIRYVIAHMQASKLLEPTEEYRVASGHQNFMVSEEIPCYALKVA
jgi:ATP-dependent DNA helicase RecQ